MKNILISGLPGKMASEVVVAASRFHPREFVLLDAALSGSRAGKSVCIEGREFDLIGHQDRRSLVIPAGTIAIDFSAPAAALENARWFTEMKIPFVMGTTGFDRDVAARMVIESEVCAVIAPNMAIPIVVIQAALRFLSENFPHALNGFDVAIRESHQSTKRDTSGTAKAIVADLNALGLPAAVDAIRKERDPAVQARDWHVPTPYLDGHAYHFYEAVTQERDVSLAFSHCIHGRRVYAEGALKAAAFLSQAMDQGSRGLVFDMEDVLRSAQA